MQNQPGIPGVRIGDVTIPLPIFQRTMDRASTSIREALIEDAKEAEILMLEERISQIKAEQS